MAFVLQALYLTPSKTHFSYFFLLGLPQDPISKPHV